jgi:predicted amidophosphoribosyltransferase
MRALLSVPVLSLLASGINMNWLNWLWWRRTGCYYFRTCIRCLTPFYRGGGLCPACEEHMRKQAQARRQAYWDTRRETVALLKRSGWIC